MSGCRAHASCVSELSARSATGPACSVSHGTRCVPEKSSPPASSTWPHAERSCFMSHMRSAGTYGPASSV